MGTHKDTQQPKMHSALTAVLIPPRHIRSLSPLDNSPLFAPHQFLPSPPPSPSTMVGPSRTKAVQPPRPPNAWILYRSEKLKLLPPREPGMPKRAQADVSREISLMWKTEPECVRAEYERLAEVRKAQHQTAYPGYRYRPLSKAEKERIRGERRLEKEKERIASKKTRSRAAPYAPAVMVPTFQSSPYYAADSQYGPCGPSPPLSAAPSPTDLTFPDLRPVFDAQTPFPVPAQREGLEYATSSSLFLPTSVHPPARSSSSRASSHSYAFTPVDAVATAANSPESVPQQAPTPTSSLWLPSTPVTSAPTPPSGSAGWTGHATEIQPARTTPPGDSNGNWPGASENEDQVPEFTNPPMVEFQLPPGNAPEIQGWAPGPNDANFEYVNSLQALLSGTADPSIFQLSGIDPAQLAANPGSEIELSFGQTGPSCMDIEYSQLFANFDMSFLDMPEPQFGDTLPLFAQHANMDNVASGSTVQYGSEMDASTSSHNSSYDASNSAELLQYLNLDPSSSSSRHSSGSQHPQLQHSSNSMSAGPSTGHCTPPPYSQPYVPPAGAAHASRRHVAASWRPDAMSVPDSPVERSTSAPWEVPAN